MSLIRKFASVLSDPPPAMAFEISEAGIALARLRPRGEREFRPLKNGVLSVSPLRDNVMDPDAWSEAVRQAAPANGKRRDATLILPDFCTRVMVLDFDNFPSDPKEQLPLVRFRIKKSVPYDVESAAVSYWAQPAGNKKFDVVVAVAPVEIVSRYEAPFRAAGFNPGLVTTSALAALELVPAGPLTAVAKMSGKVLTLLVVDKHVVKLARCLEVADPADIGNELYPTFVFIEDNFGRKAEKLLLCGFGERTEQACRQFAAELDMEVEPLRTPEGLAGPYDAGLAGYVRSLES